MKNAQKILANIYRDSVALMQISSKLCDIDGVTQASAIMATEANIELLVEAGLLDNSIAPQPNDLLIAIQGNNDDAINSAFDQSEAALNKAPPHNSDGGETILPPSSIEMALDEFPEANLALISCPGEYAGAEAMKALRLGLDVMIFSDNVSVEDEVALKQLAQESDKLVMGPDCGTAILNGVPLGFANVVTPGDIGIVAASGTGLQQVSCLVDQLGGGISQAIGTGGRDLNVKIGGLSMIKGIESLANNKATKVITLVSKPPSPEIAKKVLAEAAICGKPVVVNFIGSVTPSPSDTVYMADTLEQAAHMAIALSKGDKPSTASLPRHPIEASNVDEICVALADGQKYVRGLYSGGTFSYEAMLLLDQEIGPMKSSSPLNAEHKLNDIWTSTGNTIIDLGDDLFTRGRPHPMIDHRLRNDRIIQEAKDPETAVILLDIVIGYGSHDDPAGEMASSITAAREAAAIIGSTPVFVTFVCGTKGDPQNLSEQENKLRDAGAIVVESNAQAVRLTSDILAKIGGGS
jgi:FdrA protein